eukprot:CAMPEP_0197009374 /NCGR_PEP_ID=MMETSP1380-20130617/49866_1 /TAXON_ID=5936 /ORGANISM="Euplotes crassus, Strain CT5" /LENGTH=77 /DNA_ID=CAMNT_0042430589 /DNA_START=1 /DNA_END=234 /DNA_ORIENTATION=-
MNSSFTQEYKELPISYEVDESEVSSAPDLDADIESEFPALEELALMAKMRANNMKELDADGALSLASQRRGAIMISF